MLKYDEKVVIPAGTLTDTVKVTVANEDFARLTGPSYMAALRIVGASGVKVSSNSNVSLIYVTTRTIDPSLNNTAIPIM